mmetsp:Transcript_24500/g.37998  ORF Transcript_24500/g.37998 Transcript_24500/m.37998 type:complete len:93 (+) Transcript_24500:256-534(+)
MAIEEVVGAARLAQGKRSFFIEHQLQELELPSLVVGAQDSNPGFLPLFQGPQGIDREKYLISCVDRRWDIDLQDLPCCLLRRAECEGVEPFE